MIREHETRSAHVSYILHRIRINKNFLAVVIGGTGSGKSYFALKACQLVDSSFCADQIVFTLTEFLELLNSNKLKRGSCILFDEAGISIDSANWMSRANKAIKYIMETFRHRGYVMFFTTPMLGFIQKSSRHLIHCAITMEGIDFNKKVSTGRVKMIQTNSWTGKAYPKYLQIRTPYGVRKCKLWNLSMAKPELIEAYEKKKTEFTTKLNQEIYAENSKEDSKLTKRVATCTVCKLQWHPHNAASPTAPKCSKCQSTKTLWLDQMEKSKNA